MCCHLLCSVTLFILIFPTFIYFWKSLSSFTPRSLKVSRTALERRMSAFVQRGLRVLCVTFETEKFWKLSNCWFWAPGPGLMCKSFGLSCCIRGMLWMVFCFIWLGWMTASCFFSLKIIWFWKFEKKNNLEIKLKLLVITCRTNQEISRLGKFWGTFCNSHFTSNSRLVWKVVRNNNWLLQMRMLTHFGYPTVSLQRYSWCCICTWKHDIYMKSQGSIGVYAIVAWGRWWNFV